MGNFPTPHVIFRELTEEELLSSYTRGTSLENRLRQIARQTGRNFLLTWDGPIAKIRKGNGDG